MRTLSADASRGVWGDARLLAAIAEALGRTETADSRYADSIARQRGEASSERRHAGRGLLEASWLRSMEQTVFQRKD